MAWYSHRLLKVRVMVENTYAVVMESLLHVVKPVSIFRKTQLKFSNQFSKGKMSHNFETSIIFSLSISKSCKKKKTKIKRKKTTHPHIKAVTYELKLLLHESFPGLDSECISSWLMFLHYQTDVTINVFVHLYFCAHALLYSFQLTCSSAFHFSSVEILEHLHQNRKRDEFRHKVIMQYLTLRWSFLFHTPGQGICEVVLLYPE